MPRPSKSLDKYAQKGPQNGQSVEIFTSFYGLKTHLDGLEVFDGFTVLVLFCARWTHMANTMKITPIMAHNVHQRDRNLLSLFATSL
jgi:hypothetical protein